jgi:O-antigen/teichoic acid export membrane protein
VATSISLALFPDLQRIGRDAPERVRVLLGFASKIIWRYGILVAALMLVAIALLVMPLQPQFKPAFKLLPYFVPGVWAFWMQSFLMNALFGLRRYRLVVELHLVSLFVYVTAIYFLTQWFGVHGVVWSFNLFCLSMSFLGFRAARKAGLLERNYSLFGAFSADEKALWRQAAARARSL